MSDSIGTRHKMSIKDNHMKAKLSELGMYEEGMRREEMEQLLMALDSSKNDTLSQSTAGDVSPPSLEADSCLKRQTSVEYDDQTPTRNQRPCESKSQDDNTIVDSDEDIFDHKIDNNDKNNTINRATSTPSYANMLLQKNVNNRTMKMFAKIDNSNNELRRMDPLDHEDIPYKPLLPLRTNNPPTKQTRITLINKRPIIPLEEYEKIKKHLDDVITQWNKWELETSDEAEFRWGAPIQVGDDSAVNEKPRTRAATATTTTRERRDDDDNNVENYYENTGVALRIVDDHNDNLTQRSYVTPRRQTAKTDPYNFGDDDDDDDNTFQSQAKRPKNNNMNANNLASLRNRPPMRRKGIGPGTSQQKKYDSNEDDDGDEEWYGEGKKNEINKSFEIPEGEYIRKIPPPSRAKYVRSRKTNAKSNPLQITKQNNKGNKKVDVEEMDISESPKKPTKGPLKDDQITDLINDDDDDDDDEQNNTPDDVIDDNDEDETKLAKARSLIPAHNKLNLSLTILKNKQKSLKDQELRAQEEERINKEKEEAAKREKLNARMTKNNNLEREKEEERRLRKEKEDKYRQSFPKIGGVSDRNELKSDGDTIRPAPTSSWDPKAVAFPLATNRSTPNQKAKNVKKVNCPICNKLFPEADVAAHASTCNEFSDGNQQEPDVELVGTSSASSSKHGRRSFRKSVR
ncbi:protein PFC0760c-like isoform X2 [Aphidius gifuensis]|uniref:protein PFC0760c-like isoform X2 n=1 Tax=Aphidius gifuensis TaxID=684658 RepID=UPI001CDD79FD|nr:protein PFC0760c-like isoform X2 [Aphidius gifuensis]